MPHLEKILTLVVWVLAAGVFFYFRSLALKQQQNRGQDHRQARPENDGEC